MTATPQILEVHNLKKWFPVRTGLFALFAKQKYVRAIDDVTFDLKEGESLVVAGESGSGKTTLARTILRLIEPSQGSIRFQGEDVVTMTRDELNVLRRKIQMIFQNPFEVLDPRLTVEAIIAEGLVIHRTAETPTEIRKRVLEALEDVRLIPAEDFARRFPHELSGGQLQRVAIARSLVLEPTLIIADEPVSMLDASIRTEIMNLMMDLKKKKGLTYIFITHDLAQARYIGDHIIILYLGRIMEMGRMEEVIQNPLHPYTKALVSNVPIPDPTVTRDRIRIPGETPTPIDLPEGCRFRPRCQELEECCKPEEPELVKVGPNHYVSCWGWEYRAKKKRTPR